eukprot:TRINITY_DN48186_c0_g1_i1.p1 TRINITY_DN48186_c0_g1~~TRINITY_DN48186_c0_g1_i1.p1  ORF type:complete len:336 (+),score=10.40 TRINITY_DN48186_c0_g1_i1:80-1087(+)
MLGGTQLVTEVGTPFCKQKSRRGQRVGLLFLFNNQKNLKLVGNDGMSAVDCRPRRQSIPRQVTTQCHVNPQSGQFKGGSPEREDSQHGHPLDADALALPQFTLAHAIPVLSGAIRAHFFAEPYFTSITTSCVPIIVPFSLPDVPRSQWESDKVALAYSRCVMATVYAQAGIAVSKCLSGDFVDGIIDGIQAATGYYCVSMDHANLLPTYTVMVGLNGFLGCLQLMQNHVHHPHHTQRLCDLLAPPLRMLSASFSWQLCKTLQRVGAPHQPVVSSDRESTFVTFMSSDWLSCLLPPRSNVDDANSSRGGVFRSDHSESTFHRFNAFEGSGHRLGTS